MNKNENKYLGMIYDKVNIKGNFDTIKDKIQLEKNVSSTRKIYSLILKILMPCELFIGCVCFGLFLVNHLKPLPEGGVQNHLNIEVIYLTLSVTFVFILLITLIIYQLMKNRKEGTKNEI